MGKLINWAVVVILAVMAAASPTVARSENMGLKLEQIDDLVMQDDQERITISLGSGTVVQLDAARLGRPLQDSWLWLSQSFKAQAPIAFDASSGAILPATIAMEVQLQDQTEKQAVRVSAPPRPGFMSLDLTADWAPAVVAILRAAETDGSGVALALRDGLWIEDAEALSEAAAMRMLGF